MAAVGELFVRLNHGAPETLRSAKVLLWSGALGRGIRCPLTWRLGRVVIRARAGARGT
jgi:hypothetical protein